MKTEITEQPPDDVQKFYNTGKLPKNKPMPGNCRLPEMCLLTESCIPCAICPNAQEPPKTN